MKAIKLTKETICGFGLEPRKFPEFAAGDTIAISQWVTEGTKKRIQIFQGDVIAFHKNGISTTFTVRRIGANNVPVERIYPFYSPTIDSIEVVKRGSVRRAKLYYIRGRVGKSARIKERIMTKEQRVIEEGKRAARLAAASAQADTAAAAVVSEKSHTN